MQVNNVESRPIQRLQDDMKKPDTLLSILSVLQRSGAFDVRLQQEAEKLPDGNVIDATPMEAEVSE